MLRFMTAGESHGKCLVAILEGLPAGVPLDLSAIEAEMKRRQWGYGRGPRMPTGWRGGCAGPPRA